MTRSPLLEPGRDEAAPAPSGISHFPETGLDAELPAALVEDDLARRGPDAGDAKRSHGQQTLEGPHAAGRLDLDARRRTAAHEPQVLVGRAFVAVTRRGLDEVC